MKGDEYFFGHILLFYINIYNIIIELYMSENAEYELEEYRARETIQMETTLYDYGYKSKNTESRQNFRVPVCSV